MTQRAYRYSSTTASPHRVFAVHGSWLVVLPVPTQADLAEQIWALVVDGSVSCDDVEHAIRSRGDDAPNDWSIVHWSDHGDVRVRLSGSESIDVWSDDRWSRLSADVGREHLVREVTFIICGEAPAVVGGAPTGAGVPIQDGVVVAQRLDGRRPAPRGTASTTADDALVPGGGDRATLPSLVGSEGASPLVPAVRVHGFATYALDTTYYFGRSPRQPRIPLPDPARCVALQSPTKVVSATHLEISVVEGVIVATDLRSTNGTAIWQPGHAWRDMQGGEPVVVVEGTQFDLGDGNLLEIVRIDANAVDVESTDPRHEGVDGTETATMESNVAP